jgi:vitamin B12 transporter
MSIHHPFASRGVATLAAALVPLAVHAAGDELDEVLVTGRLEETLPQDLSRYGVRVETLAGERIDRGGFVDVSQALQSLVSGLYVAPLSGAFDYVETSFLGSRNSELLWLVDGVRLNNRLYSTTTPLDTLPAHMVERIEVLEGGEGLFYGTQAVAGAVNIVTKQFADKPEGQVQVGLDTNDGRRASGYYRTALGDHRIVVFGSKDKADGFQPFSDADYQPSATDRKRGYDVGNYGIKYAYDFGDAVRTSFGYQHTDATLDYARPFDIAKASNKRDEDLLTGKVDISVGEDLQLYLKGYYHDWDTHYYEADNDGAGGIDVVSDNDFWGFKDYGGNLLAKFAPGGPLEYFAGWDYQHYSGEDQVFLIAPLSETVHAPFAQVRTSSQFSEDLRLSLGARYNNPSHGQSATVWNATSHWNITDRLFMRTNFGTAFRLPDAYELFVVDPCCEQGNPDLKPERSKFVNASLGGHGGARDSGMDWEVVLFAREVKDLIDIVTGPGGIDTLANTADRTRVQGAEIILAGRLSRDLHARFSYTKTDAHAKGSSEQQQETPTDLAKLALDYSPAGALYAGLSLAWTGDVFRNAAGARHDYGNYFLLDLNAGLRLGQDGRHRIGLRLENALDETYASRVRSGTTDGGDAYAFSFLGTPRTLHATYAYRF